MADLTNKITDITIGIRFNRSFRVKDVLGAITDQLVYKKNSPLKGYFDQQQQDNREMVLINAKGAYLRLNTDDIIFKHVLEKDFQKEISFMNCYCNFVFEIFKAYKISNVNRVGIIFTHQLENDEKKFNQIIKGLTNGHINDTQDFSLSFSKKLPTLEGQVKKDVQDYKNVIYSFKKLGEKSLGIGLDYQNYFIPPIEDINDFKTDLFIKETEKYLKETFYANLSINDDEQGKS